LKFELISAVKMETRHPVEGYFVSAFPAVWNHFGVMAAWSRKSGKRVQFWRFLEKRPLTGKFSKFSSETIHYLTDPRLLCKFREIWPTGNR